jgi:hypothetical protein
MDAIPLARAVGERFRAIRSENGIPLERIAAEARQLGLTWAKSSVASLEAGRHAVDLGELLLLPTILARAGAWAYEYTEIQGPRKGLERVKTGHHPVGMTDLLPDDDRLVLLAGTVQMPAQALRDLLAQLRVRSLDNLQTAARLKLEGLKGSVGEETADEALRLPRLWCSKMIESIRKHQAARFHREEWHPDHDEEFWPSIGRDAADDATRKAAAVLGVPAIAVALAARACWNGVWGLTGEREHRLAGSLLVATVPNVRITDREQIERDWKLSEEEKQALGDWHLRGTQERALTPGLRRKLQAVRGHFTRQLLNELRPLLADVTKKKRRKTR